MDSIFVQIPAYRDTELVATVADLFRKAEHGGRVFVGICWQHQLGSEASGELEFEELGEFRQHVRILNKESGESEGMGWAKHCAQTLYRGEDTVLAVDSHSRFEEAWDTTLIELLKQCPSEKAIISASPHPYRLNEDRLAEEVATFRYPSHFTDKALLKLVSRRFNKLPNSPLQAPFLCPRFLFARAQFIRDVPADPFIYFSEEEIVLSIRAWCAGWDVYHPPRVPVWHLYNTGGKLRPLHWKENADWRKYQQRSLDCYKYYVDDDNKDDDINDEADQYFDDARANYKLQSVRKLSDFQVFAGVDLQAQKFLAGASESSFIHSLAPFYDDAEKLRSDSPVEPVTGNIELSAQANRAEISENELLLPKIDSKYPLHPIEPLELGDRVPYFSLTDVHGKTCHSEIYAGQTLFLHVVCTPNRGMVGDSQPALDFVEKLAACDEQVKAWRKLGKFDRLCIYPGNLESFTASGFGILNSRWCLDPQAKLLDVLQVEKHAKQSPGLLTYILDSNLKILAIVAGDDIREHLHQPIERLLTAPSELKIITDHPPVMVIPDILNSSLIDRLLNYWQTGEQFEGAVGAGQKSKVRPGSKRRTDVSVVDQELSAAIDQAFAKNLFPELRKITGYELKFRERYKLGCYSAAASGKFAKHRDTGNVSLSFRRYAVSLMLNEDYGGGELVFPEYGNYGYKTKTGSAVVFPTPLLHEVLPITSGQRFVLVSFLFDEEQAAFRSCYRQFYQDLDNTAEYRTTVESHFSGLPTRSIYTRSLKAESIDRQAFALRTDEQPIEELQEISDQKED